MPLRGERVISPVTLADSRKYCALTGHCDARVLV
jgi:hypothetical protein